MPTGQNRYEVQLALIATKPELSYLSTLIRYEELYIINPNQARATPKEHPRANVPKYHTRMECLGTSVSRKRKMAQSIKIFITMVVNIGR